MAIQDVKIMQGGSGDDFFFVTNGSDLIIEQPDGGTDTVLSAISYTLPANVENLLLYGYYDVNATGNDSDNLLFGNSGKNDLTGLGGNDILNGDSNADRMWGGMGDDLYSVDDAGDLVIEEQDQGNDTVQSSVNFILPDNVENLVLLGDATVGIGNAESNVLIANNLGNILFGGGGNDFLGGGDGNDTLEGDRGNDYMLGGDGDDTYVYKLNDGFDQIADQSGSNTLRFGAGLTLDNLALRIVTVNGQQQAQIRVLGANGNEQSGQGIKLDVNTDASGQLRADIQHYLLSDGQTLSLNDLLIKQATITGTNKNDVLIGGRNDDLIQGSNGNDILSGMSGNDTLDGGNGADLMQGGGGNDVINGGNGNDWIAGGAGDDTINAGSGNNVIAFNRADGADRIISSNNDNNTISLGNDIHYADLSLSKSGNDLVLDLGQGDSITMQDWYAGASHRGIKRLQFVDAGSAYASSSQGSDAHSACQTGKDAVEIFDFGKLVANFNATRTCEPAINQWSVMDGLLRAHLSGSDRAAIGADLSYQFAVNGSLSGMSVNAMQGLLSSSAFNSGTPQALRLGAATLNKHE